MPNTVRLHRVLAAKPEKVYRAFLEADALAKWLPPNGFACTVHHLEAAVGGTHRMSFRNFTTGNSHSFGGEYLELVPNERLRYTDKFADPNLPGQMHVTVTLRKVAVGTELNIVQEGVPWVIPLVLGVLAVWTILLGRTRYGRYVYAIGGNPEAARRAGVNLSLIRTTAFMLCSFTACIGMILYASYLNGMSSNVQGGQYVLYAVAAAVIGGTSLFGGRGKPLHGVLGGLVIGGIYNGMFLIGLSFQWEYIVTGLVLLGAVTIDALSRRGSASGSVGRV